MMLDDLGEVPLGEHEQVAGVDGHNGGRAPLVVHQRDLLHDAG